MTFNRVFTFFAIALIGCSASTQGFLSGDFEKQGRAKIHAESLPPLQGDSSQVSVSGISAGAFMATQLQVAFSASIMGVGSVAGGPWYCAKNSIISAYLDCMNLPSNIEPSALVAEAKSEVKKNHIDSLDHLKTARVYLFNSKKDNVVHEPMNAKTKEFFQAFVAKANILNETSIPSAHGFPTIDYGVDCGDQASPYITKCGYDGTGEMLKHIYASRTMNRAPYLASSMHVFDQTEFGADAALLDKTGWVYIPDSCLLSGAKCAVHVALHGCLQSVELIKDAFTVHAGYNEWAEGSKIIILYPQTMKSSDNPNACFDWWGYTGGDYANRNGIQMKAIKAMIDRLTGS